MTEPDEPLSKWEYYWMGFWLGISVGILIGFWMLFQVGAFGL